MAERRKRIQVAVAAVIGLVSCSAHGQVIMDGPTAFDNVNLALGNAPGSMVTAGITRAKDAAEQGRAQVTQPEITETEPTLSLREQFLADVADIFLTAIDDLVNQFVQTLFGVVTGWLSDAGLIPDTSSLGDLIPSNGTDGTTTGDQAGTDTTDDQANTGADTTDDGTDATDTTDGSSTDTGDSTDTGTTDDSTTDSGTTDTTTGGRTGRSGRR